MSKPAKTHKTHKTSKMDKRLLGVIHLDVFHLQVGVFRTLAACRSYLADQGVAVEWEDDRPVFGQATRDHAPDGTAWFSLVITEEATKATWAHECVHMADWVMDRLGIPTGAENSEVRGYLTGHLFAGIEEMLG